MDKPEIDFPEGPPPGDLEITDLAVGDGAEATAGSTAVVHYVGVAYSSGEEFDASWNRGQSFAFPLGAGNVIAGWDRGVVGMKVGGRRRLVGIISIGDVVKHRIDQLEFERDQLDSYVHQT